MRTLRLFALSLAVIFLELVSFSQTLFYDRSSFLGDGRVTNNSNINFDSLTIGTDLRNQNLSGIRFGSPSGSALLVIAATNGVRNTLSPSSVPYVVSPGGTDPGLEDDDLSLNFDTPVRAFGLDVVFDAPDGASYVGVSFYDAAGNQIANNAFIPAPNGVPGFQFVGLVTDAPIIKQVVFDEFDPTAPDDNVAYDSVIFNPAVTPPSSNPCFPPPSGSCRKSDRYLGAASLAR